MGRPRTINRDGDTKITSVVLAGPVYRSLVTEAKGRGITLGALIRERLGDRS